VCMCVCVYMCVCVLCVCVCVCNCNCMSSQYLRDIAEILTSTVPKGQKKEF